MKGEGAANRDSPPFIVRGGTLAQCREHGSQDDRPKLSER
jgi:hypothetical protein